MMPYVCKGTIVNVAGGYTGKIIGINRETKIAVIYTGKVSIATKLENVEVVSYKDVDE